MAYIPLNEIVDALEELEPQQETLCDQGDLHIQNVNAYHYVAYHRFLDGTTLLSSFTRTRELYHQVLRQPMKTTGKALPHYCENEIQKMAS